MTADAAPEGQFADLPDQKSVAVYGQAEIATVLNALDAAKEQADVHTDKAALVELARSYTGWSAAESEGWSE